ncbi:tRNA-dihydrouridine synthase [Radiomyces spectabilis]|uniref:tRNA-dihydrouridine synthase n=1 Tax=Radiomyces spectabilis TaxID=64574 RepID=UPI002220B892|nr:tRNA-dihydrouridine synthase [Radiomyces spectabilis]KAI8388042.1 tRNA-dihydrouridine synthase [Radiomyces spectabilis]
MLQRCRPWRLAQLSVRNYGTGRLPRPISVAPMVDISTPSFLELLHIISGSERYAYYTEMHHAHAILHHSDHLARFVGRPRSNVVVQLGGSEPQLMAKAAKILEDNGYQEVNINVGCPSPRVQSGQFGAVLMKSPDVVAKILEAMTTAEVSIPVTIKCRLGVDDLDTFDFLYQFVETLLNCKRPPPHLIVHARKCILQGLSPKDNRSIPPLNYDRVYRLAETFPSLPISINGGFNDTLMVSMALSKVDGCMIGRQIMNDPLFLQRLDQGMYCNVFAFFFSFLFSMHLFIFASM